MLHSYIVIRDNSSRWRRWKRKRLDLTTKNRQTEGMKWSDLCTSQEKHDEQTSQCNNYVVHRDAWIIWTAGPPQVLSSCSSVCCQLDSPCHLLATAPVIVYHAVVTTSDYSLWLTRLRRYLSQASIANHMQAHFWFETVEQDVLEQFSFPLMIWML